MAKGGTVASRAAEETQVMDSSLKQTEERLPLEDWPLTTLREYRTYNEEARRMNKKLRISRYPIKQCPVDLHPKIRIVFGRVDQPTNPLHVLKSDHMIHFEQTLIPGQVYDLPEYIVNYLSEKGAPIWDWVEGKDGARETKVISKTPRFTLRTVYNENN